jgi:hypothetical protein
VAVVACLEKFGAIGNAERALGDLGPAIQASGVR